MDIEDIDGFRALARSSRVLWSTVRFTWTVGAGEPRRAWVRRPDAVWVEGVDGEVRIAERQRPRATSVGGWVILDEPTGRRAVRAAEVRVPVATALMMLRSGDDPTRRAEMSAAEAIAALPVTPPPVRRADRLLAALPGSRFDDTVPFFENYHWVAMLDPVELADGATEPSPAVEPFEPSEASGTHLAAPDLAPPPGSYADLRPVTHHGRPALEVTITPDTRYDPRCGCCPLLDGAVALAAEEAAYGGPLPGYADGRPRPDATRFRVRMDRGTGLCVAVEPLDATRSVEGDRLDVAIEAVDEPFPDDLFRSGRGRRRRGPDTVRGC